MDFYLNDILRLLKSKTKEGVMVDESGWFMCYDEKSKKNVSWGCQWNLSKPTLYEQDKEVYDWIFKRLVS